MPQPFEGSIPFTIAAITAAMATVAEWRRGSIPNLITLPLLFVGLAIAVRDANLATHILGLVGALVVALPLYALRWVLPSGVKLMLGVCVTLGGKTAAVVACSTLLFVLLIQASRQIRMARSTRLAIVAEAPHPVRVGLGLSAGILLAWTLRAALL
jgi:Flp pilus assembly protein protease CpaA